MSTQHPGPDPDPDEPITYAKEPVSNQDSPQDAPPTAAADTEDDQ